MLFSELVSCISFCHSLILAVRKHLHQHVGQNVDDVMGRTFRFTRVKNFLAYDSFHRQTRNVVHLIRLAEEEIGNDTYQEITNDSSPHDELSRHSLSCLRRSSISSSALSFPWASFRIFCRTASDFLEACFVKQSAI